MSYDAIRQSQLVSCPPYLRMAEFCQIAFKDNSFMSHTLSYSRLPKCGSFDGRGLQLVYQCKLIKRIPASPGPGISPGTMHNMCRHLYTFLIFQGDIIPIKRSESLDVIVPFVLQVETPEALS